MYTLSEIVLSSFYLKKSISWIIVVTPVLTSPISTPFLFVSRNAIRTHRWRHCMLFYTVKKNV